MNIELSEKDVKIIEALVKNYIENEDTSLVDDNIIDPNYELTEFLSRLRGSKTAKNPSRSSLSKLYRWVETILGSEARDRKEVVDRVLSEMRRLGTEEALEVIAAHRDGRLELVGIAPEVSYMRVKGDREDLEPIWVHRFGTPKLLFKVHGAPILVMAGSRLNFNESEVLRLNGEAPEVKGLTE